jgi:hypothetical protein
MRPAGLRESFSVGDPHIRDGRDDAYGKRESDFNAATGHSQPDPGLYKMSCDLYQ